MNPLSVFFQKDSIIFGIILAVLLPLVTALILYPVFLLFINLGWTAFNLPLSKYLILGCAPSLFIARYYLKKMQYEKTGKGLLFTTLILLFVQILLNRYGIF